MLALFRIAIYCLFVLSCSLSKAGAIQDLRGQSSVISAERPPWRSKSFPTDWPRTSEDKLEPCMYKSMRSLSPPVSDWASHELSEFKAESVRSSEALWRSRPRSSQAYPQEDPFDSYSRFLSIQRPLSASKEESSSDTPASLTDVEFERSPSNVLQKQQNRSFPARKLSGWQRRKKRTEKSFSQSSLESPEVGAHPQEFETLSSTTPTTSNLASDEPKASLFADLIISELLSKSPIESESPALPHSRSASEDGGCLKGKYKATF
ncbi:hypothetical protein O181_000705 [Austropuccinia psidii MF-1]|uniref:Uncharacterized protein n=1 Tax=Austropuccinia psidii MF-1 TaxID=1389203 RepID=A0A9Q3GB49_9BASI|nr:hypothetical protein [Austropuccinia psidii MF-1]